ncbi:MerR family transcriptional regulator [Psychrobacillus psychrodurans]|uniref:MerR family transcriptional regulator n=1 Tax=Psychrobacillus psychrodurans TaxID=126157 RepID=UPI0008E7ADC7|nr:MerR family transcriptional regulator [Psychrobacillus psychrodurans]MCK1999563.1 MerR family transcriptional regulator [Psychrobacillus psychrodurans]MCZ8542319.1 MerR family transcriptional regulator [Psychrobacillus psychrodurans]SFN25313.1 DNA-binding transcriptional regulator, MerR family [Psychrobacillus psychrodurans]
MYTVKEVARITGLTEHAVRFYTDKGLVPSVQRNQNNFRMFDEESINWLHGIKCLKQSGMPVDVIKTYIDLCIEGDSTIPQRYTLMMEHKEDALAKLEEAKLHVAHLEEKTALYQDILENRSPDTTNPAHWDRIQHMHGDVFYSRSATR